jgi:shikimate dehydrogenase
VTAFRSVQNFDGLVVTVPHKIDIAGLVDEVGPMAGRIGAVNAVLKTASGRLAGENFDGAGFIQGLGKHGHSLAGKKVLVIGAGGAGKAVAHAIVDRGPAELALFDIDAARSAELATELAAFGHARVAEGPHASGFDVVVNCTSIGMKPGDDLPCTLDGLSAGGLVVDIVLKPPRTRFLNEAQARGFATVEGIHMLEGQIDVICDFFGLTDPTRDASV